MVTKFGMVLARADFENDYHYDNQEVYEVKVVLYAWVLLRYGCA